MNSLKKSFIYVTRDIERALGMEPAGDYFVISNDSRYGREIRKKYPDNVCLVKDFRGALDTHDLLLSPEVQETISGHKAGILVFQNTARIERLAKEKNWNLLNPPAGLAKKVEEKISQVKWLGNDARFLPPHKMHTVKEVRFDRTKFVLQFNHSHTGQGTFIIDTEAKLKELMEKFPDRECRVSDFIDGPVFTVNIVVAGKDILIGNPSYQITGLSSFTDLPFSTIGNDFALPHAPQYKKAREKTLFIASKVGERMAKSGWKGLFGIDVIHDEKTGKTYLLEINARQPASAVFESKLQRQSHLKFGSENMSIFETHITALAGESVRGSPTTISSGAQIVKRVTKKVFKTDIVSLRKRGLDVIEYENDIHNQELLRIQSREGIMRGHGKLNDLGSFIASCIR